MNRLHPLKDKRRKNGGYICGKAWLAPVFLPPSFHPTSDPSPPPFSWHKQVPLSLLPHLSLPLQLHSPHEPSLYPPALPHHRNQHVTLPISAPPLSPPPPPLPLPPSIPSTNLALRALCVVSAGWLCCRLQLVRSCCSPRQTPAGMRAATAPTIFMNASQPHTQPLPLKYIH